MVIKSYRPADPLAPARGIFNGAIASAALWCAVVAGWAVIS